MKPAPVCIMLYAGSADVYRWSPPCKQRLSSPVRRFNTADHEPDYALDHSGGEADLHYQPDYSLSTIHIEELPDNAPWEQGETSEAAGRFGVGTAGGVWKVASSKVTMMMAIMRKAD